MIAPSRRSLSVAGIGAVAMLLILAIPETAMRRRGSGIFDVEMVRTPERAAHVLDTLGDGGRRALTWSLIGDFGFVVAYTSFAVLACIAVGKALASARPGFARLARHFAAAAVIAAAADCIENANLLAILVDSPRSPYPQIAFVAACIKFALIFGALAYAAIGGVLVLRSRTNPA